MRAWPLPPPLPLPPLAAPNPNRLPWWMQELRLSTDLTINWQGLWGELTSLRSLYVMVPYYRTYALSLRLRYGSGSAPGGGRGQVQGHSHAVLSCFMQEHPP